MSIFSSLKPDSRKVYIAEVMDKNKHHVPTGHDLTGVVNVYFQRIKHWKIAFTNLTSQMRDNGTYDHRGTVAVSRQEGSRNENSRGTISYIEIWQRIPWWRRILPWGIHFMELNKTYNLIIPKSGEAMFQGIALNIGVVSPVRKRLGGFLVQTVLWREKPLSGRNRVYDPGDLLNHPSAWWPGVLCKRPEITQPDNYHEDTDEDVSNDSPLDA